MAMAAIAGQKSLGSGREAADCSAWSGGEINVSIGNTVKAKAQAKLGMIAHMSAFGLEDLGRRNLRAPTKRLGTRALHQRPKRPPAMRKSAAQGCANGAPAS